MKSLAFALLLALAVSAQAQSLTDGRAALERATLANDVDALRHARGMLHLAAATGGADAHWATYYTALADYRLSYALWGSQPEAAGEHARLGADALADLTRQRGLADGLRAEALALYAALLGARIGLDPALGMTLGGTSHQVMNEAVRLAPDNPRVQFVQATTLLSTPPEWGGNPARAAELLRSALTTYRQPAAEASEAPTWGHADAAAWLGMAYLMENDPAAARPLIEEAEALDPNSSFVQYKLKGWLAQLESQAASDG